MVSLPTFEHFMASFYGLYCRPKKTAVDLFLTITWETSERNGPFAASGHMVHAGGQAALWNIQNKENSNLS